MRRRLSLKVMNWVCLHSAESISDWLFTAMITIGIIFLRSLHFPGAIFLHAFTFFLRGQLPFSRITATWFSPTASAVLLTYSSFLAAKSFFLFKLCWSLDSFNRLRSLFAGFSALMGVTCVAWLTFPHNAFFHLGLRSFAWKFFPLHVRSPHSPLRTAFSVPGLYDHICGDLRRMELLLKGSQ